jgi:hypothetical protein
MHDVWTCVVRGVATILAAEACTATKTRRSSRSALLALGAVSVQSRKAVHAACEAMRCLEGEDERIAPHVRLSTRTVAAYSSALCLLCGKRVRAARVCSFAVHQTCVHKHRVMFAPLRIVKPTKLPFLVVDAFAYRRFPCVLVDPTWRFKHTATPSALADRVARRAANGIRS